MTILILTVEYFLDNKYAYKNYGRFVEASEYFNQGSFSEKIKWI